MGGASGVNLSGQIVGDIAVGTYGTAVMWDSQLNLIDLWTDGRAYGINDAGQVVGDAMYGPGNPGIHAIVWSSQGGMTDLGQGSARTINSVGQIIGSQWDYTYTHAVRWDPVPEPQSCIVLLTGAGLWAGGALRRKRSR